jgi:hypothetical protein
MSLFTRRFLHPEVGTVVEELAPNVYEVECSDNAGRTYALAAVQAQQLMVLHYTPVLAGET